MSDLFDDIAEIRRLSSVPQARRDLFAAAALQGLLGGRGGWPEGHTEEENYRAIARHAVGIGDHLLQELDKTKGVAAAPLLLDAFKHIVESCRRIYVAEDTEAIQREVIAIEAIVQAAVSKATGAMP